MHVRGKHELRTQTDISLLQKKLKSIKLVSFTMVKATTRNPGKPRKIKRREKNAKNVHNTIRYIYRGYSVC